MYSLESLFKKISISFFILFLIPSLSIAQAGMIMAEEFGNYDLSQSKIICSVKTFEGCGGNVTVYEFKNGEKILSKTEYCDDGKKELIFIKFNKDNIISVYEKKTRANGEVSQAYTEASMNTYKYKFASNDQWKVCGENNEAFDCKGWWKHYIKLGNSLVSRFDTGVLNIGQELKPNEALWSKNKAYYLNFNDDGNLCIYTKENAWQWCLKTSAGDSEPSKNRLKFTEDKNMILYAFYEKEYWSAKKNLNLNTNEIHKIVLTDEGSLQFQGYWGNVVWKSK